MGLENSEGVPEKNVEVAELKPTLSVRMLKAPSGQTKISKIPQEVDSECVEIDLRIGSTFHVEDAYQAQIQFHCEDVWWRTSRINSSISF
jgi:hypothetical protein